MEFGEISDLMLECVAIGSLPYKNPDKAMNIIKKYSSQIPCWPQLVKLNQNEDILNQFLENMSLFFVDKIDEFNSDYKTIISNINCREIEKYGISKNYSAAFPLFEHLVASNRPKFAKGQITGPYTILKSIKKCDYDKIFISKLLTLKALWQIKHIKNASPDTIPIIFIDEPSISIFEDYKKLNLSKEDLVLMIADISSEIKKNVAISGFHCCDIFDWEIPIKSGVDIISFDAYSFCDKFEIPTKNLEKFLQQGGMLAFGMVPTHDNVLLDKLTLDDLVFKFEKTVKNLTNEGINEKIIINNSIITSSCGAGRLDEEHAAMAMKMIRELSKRLKDIYLER